MNQNKSNPILVVGMHRSGTSLISRKLEEMNVFQGCRKEENNEATFYKRINDKLLNYSGASWDAPEAFQWVLKNKTLADEMLEDITKISNSWRSIEFWGIGEKSRYASGWGWKDPRLSITAPLWLRIYKNAHLLRVVRNGVDVAASLWSREKKRKAMRRGRRKLSVRCLTLEGAFSLWSYYVKIEDEWLNNIDNPVYTIKYEDLLRQPESVLKGVADFVGVDYKASLADGIQGGRRYSFVGNALLEELYENVKDDASMIKYGYQNILGNGD